MRNISASNSSLRCISLALSIAVLSGGVASCSSSEPAAQTTPVTEVTTLSPTPTPTPNCPDQVVIIQGDIVFGQILEDYYLVDCAHTDYVDLEYNIQPRDVNVAVEEWSSSDESVATVDNNGKVTPVGVGECEISLHVTDGLTDGAYTSIVVTVEDGIIRFDDCEIPGYEELKAEICDVYGAETIDDYGTHYSNYWSYLDSTDLPFLYCDRYDDDMYEDYGSLEKNLLGTNTEYIICQNTQCVLMIYPGGIVIICDEYMFGVDCSDTEESMDVAESLGYTIPRDQIDLSELNELP